MICFSDLSLFFSLSADITTNPKEKEKKNESVIRSLLERRNSTCLLAVVGPNRRPCNSLVRRSVSKQPSSIGNYMLWCNPFDAGPLHFHSLNLISFSSMGLYPSKNPKHLKKQDSAILKPLSVINNHSFSAISHSLPFLSLDFLHSCLVGYSSHSLCP